MCCALYYKMFVPNPRNKKRVPLKDNTNVVNMLANKRIRKTGKQTTEKSADVHHENGDSVRSPETMKVLKVVLPNNVIVSKQVDTGISNSTVSNKTDIKTIAKRKKSSRLINNKISKSKEKTVVPNPNFTPKECTVILTRISHEPVCATSTPTTDNLSANKFVSNRRERESSKQNKKEMFVRLETDFESKLSEKVSQQTVSNVDNNIKPQNELMIKLNKLDLLEVEPKHINCTATASKPQNKIDTKKIQQFGIVDEQDLKNYAENSLLYIPLTNLSDKSQDKKNTGMCTDKRPELKILRAKEPKNYTETSSLSISPNGKNTNMCESLTLRVQDPRKYDEGAAMPIYRIKLPDESKKTKNPEDLYEFNELSPKRCVKVNRERRSSIPFDKAIQDIVKKLEAKEIKEKKRAVRNLKKPKVKSYNRIVKGIVKGVMKKVNENKAQDNRKIVKVNPLSEEINVIVHAPAEITNATTSHHFENITIRKPDVSKPILPQKSVLFDEITVCDDDNDHFVHFDEPDQSDDEDDNEQNAIDTCFGFNDDNSPSQSNKIQILSDVLLTNSSTPNNYQQLAERRPNANSTMFSPWRSTWISSRPHFVSVKSNALPRIDQEMVLDYTLASGLEESASKTPLKVSNTPTRKELVQQTLLDFIQSNIENNSKITNRSLYDYEEFHSPTKKQEEPKNNQVKNVKRVLGEIENVVSSTPLKRRALQDITNSSGEQNNESNSNENTYFGFDDTVSSLRKKSPKKMKENKENSPLCKPSRFDPNSLRIYKAKHKKDSLETTKSIVEEIPPSHNENLDKSVSLIEDSHEADSGDFKLFDDPEDILDLNPMIPTNKKRRRRRLNSTNSDASDIEQKQKKHKKTKLEIEQEQWIEEFNKECDNVENHQLNVE